MNQSGSDQAFRTELRRAVDASRQRVGALRYPLAAAALVLLLTSGWVLATDRRHVLIFYGPAIVLAIAASSRHHRDRARREGLRLPIRTWAAGAVALMVPAAALARIGTATGNERLEIAGPSLVFAFGYFAIGVWAQNRVLLWCCAGMVLATMIWCTVLTGDGAVAAQLATYGGLLALAAFCSREVTDA